MAINPADLPGEGECSPPVPAGRTPQAKVRNYLADRRSALADQRTALSRGRTGLAFFRTGIALVTIAVTVLRTFGVGLLLPLDVVLGAGGMAAIYDGLLWYLPVRGDSARRLEYDPPARPPGVSILQVENEISRPVFVRVAADAAAGEMRADWDSLSPIERRRFLANDRTGMAEERTYLASLRTTMAKSRMGLAFTRSGVAFAGLGIALIRKFPATGWTYFDYFLIVVGVLMTLEGFFWYVPGYRAGLKGMARFKRSLQEEGIWDELFPRSQASRKSFPAVNVRQAPGIWGTTGLALERTILADRRNLMSRLRTIMAYSRTGLAFVRTGMSISAVGVGLIAFFTVNLFWAIFDSALILGGVILIVDGLRWYRHSERTRRQFPYCYGDVEISRADYGIPRNRWGKVVFSHDDL
ncbi:MAG: YidH family protein [Thermoleophilia bacterium]